MKRENDLRLFILNTAVVKAELDRLKAQYDMVDTNELEMEKDEGLAGYILQFEIEARIRAKRMARYYAIFHLLENEIRKFIRETLVDAHGPEWWKNRVPPNVIQEAEKNRDREAEAGVAMRSDELIDYTTFGQLGDIIRDNWDVFGGLLSNQKAVSRVMAALNMLRGPIAHCGVLADDEVDRLKLAVKDWFRIMQGPNG